MILRVNGEDRQYPSEISDVGRLLEKLGIKADRAAVEINGIITDPKQFCQTQLHEKDQIEIVSFVGGG
jgi:sulfur carrier protein